MAIAEEEAVRWLVLNVEARPCSCHWLNPVSVSWGSVSSWSLDCVWHLAFVKADVVSFLFFYRAVDYLSIDSEKTLLHCVPSNQVTAPGVTQLHWQSPFFFQLEKGRNTCATVPFLSKRENEATSLVKKSNSVLTHLKSREQGKGSWFVCTWKRFQDSTMLISASLKWRLSAASQALARQQTLTRNKTDNLEKKNKNKKLKWKYYGYTE